MLVDWTGDEANIRVSLLDPSATRYGARDELDDDLEVNPFRSRWRGVGKRPGVIALVVVLGLSLGIGASALLGPSSGAARRPGNSPHALP